MSLEERLNALQEKIEAGLSEHQLQTMRTATDALIRSGAKDKAIKAGQEIPEFDLVDQDSYEISAAELCQSGRVLITFYRGVWSPYCNVDLAYLNRMYPMLLETGTQLVAIAPNLPQYSKQAISRHGLKFPIYTDYGNRVAEKFGIKTELPLGIRELYLNLWNIDLERYNGDDSWTLPMPSRFLVNTSGTIEYADSSPDFTKRSELNAVFEILQMT